jgi:hypothetical protein
MPVGPVPPGCVALCTAIAFDGSAEVDVTGTCQISTDGVVLSDVTVVSCTIDSVSFAPATARAVTVTVAFTVAFTFTGTADGFTFQGSGSCQDTLAFDAVVLPTESTLLLPLDCTASLVCTATDGGFDPVTGTQTFNVHVTDSVSCVGCVPTVAVVQACPPQAAGQSA